MVDWLTADARARIAAAIAAAEARTSGEIVCTCSDARHVYAEWLLPLAMALTLGLPLLATLLGAGPALWAGWLPAWAAATAPVLLYALAQMLILLLATALLWFTPLGLWLTPHRIRRAHVHEVALAQFLGKGIHLTAARTGVLIHLSLNDHVAEVIADARIYRKVPPAHWADTVAALLDGVTRGDPVQGFIDAIALAGAVLADNFPPQDGARDELPNQLLIV